MTWIIEPSPQDLCLGNFNSKEIEVFYDSCDIMDDKKLEEIRKQAKGILDNFSKALEKVKIGKKEAKKEAGGFRDEEEGKKEGEDFRKRMFENAPNKDGDCIVAEKKTW